MAIKSIIGATCACLAVVSFSANSALVTLSKSYIIDYVLDTHGYLDGVLTVGDTVHVDAYYNTDSAAVYYNREDNNYYSFQEGDVGLRYTVNGYIWETTSRFTVGSIPVSVSVGESSWGSIQWIGGSDGISFGHMANDIITPIDIGDNPTSHLMSYLPKFNAGTIDGSLPTYIDLAELSINHPGVTGAMREYNSINDQYFFNFGSSIAVPIPSAVWLFGSGLIGLIGLARCKA